MLNLILCDFVRPPSIYLPFVSLFQRLQINVVSLIIIYTDLQKVAFDHIINSTLLLLKLNKHGENNKHIGFSNLI